MKKYIVTAMLLLICQFGFSQKYSVNQLFKEFGKVKQSEKVKMGKLIMGFAGLFTDTMGVDGIEVYDFDSCSREIKERLANAVKGLNDSAYETMISSNEDGERTKILVKIEKDMIRELVIIVTGDSNALVRIKGEINPSDIEQVTQKHGKGGC